MQDRLSRIDWNAIGEHQIPEQLAALTSQDKEVWLQAYHALEDRLIPWPAFDDSYGTPDQFKSALRNDVQILVVPFLIDLVANETVLRRDGIIELLHNLARYAFAANSYTSPNREADQPYRLRAQKIHEAIREGIPVYQSMLNSDDEQIRQGAQDILRILKFSPTSN